MTPEQQIVQLQGEINELRLLVSQFIVPGGFLFKRDTTIGIKDTKVTIGAAASRVALFGAAPTIQYSTAGTGGGYTAVGITPMGIADIFDGGVGSTKYNITDVVRALKLLGVFAP